MGRLINRARHKMKDANNRGYYKPLYWKANGIVALGDWYYSKLECPICRGYGNTLEYVADSKHCTYQLQTVECKRCNGTTFYGRKYYKVSRI